MGATNLLAAPSDADPYGMTTKFAPPATPQPRASTVAWPRMVGDVMSRAVVVAYPGATAEDIARALCRDGVDIVPVIDEDRRVIGVVSAFDLLTPALPERPGETHRVITAHELMTSPPITTTVSAPIAEAGARMVRHGVHSLPVATRDGVLVGVVARTDIVRAFLGLEDRAT